MNGLQGWLSIAVDAAPWLLLGLIAAGLIKAFVAEQVMRRWVGGEGVAAVTRAAIIGAPLPLCSCGAIPTAMSLHRGGAGRGPTTAFLVGTPGIGVDSLAITYALLGPFMMVARAFSAVSAAIATGMIVGWTGRGTDRAAGAKRQAKAADRAAAHVAERSAATVAEGEEGEGSGENEGTGGRRVHAGAASATVLASASATSACGGGCCGTTTAHGVATGAVEGHAALSGSTPGRAASLAQTDSGWFGRLRHGMRYAFCDLLCDIGPWLLIGLLIAGALVTWVPPDSLARHGSGWGAMLLMALVGIPLYICATAATPIAAGMVLAGVSPGTALVFLIAGPVTSAATLALLRKEMGSAALMAYLTGIVGCALFAGVVTDALVGTLGVDVRGQIGEVRELVPDVIGVMALAVLLVAGSRPLRGWLVRQLSARGGRSGAL